MIDSDVVWDQIGRRRKGTNAWDLRPFKQVFPIAGPRTIRATAFPNPIFASTSDDYRHRSWEVKIERERVCILGVMSNGQLW